MDNTATGGVVSEENEQLLTSNWHQPGVRGTTICFIIDKEKYVSRDNTVKNT